MSQKLILLFSLFTSTSNILYSQTGSVLDKIVTEYDLKIEGLEKDYKDSIDAMTEDYNRQLKLLQERQELFFSNMSQEWGDAEIIEGDNKTWIEYGQEQNSRSVVNFETGEVTLEILLDETEINSDNNIINTKLQGAVEDLLSSRGRPEGSGLPADYYKNVSTGFILENQLDLGNLGIDLSTALAPVVRVKEPPKPKVGQGAVLPEREKRTSTSTTTKVEERALSKESLEEMIITNVYSSPQIPIIAESIVKKDKPIISKVKNNKGEKKVVAKITIKLNEDHISKRAAEYRDLVTFFSKKFGIAEPVIFAIMEQESAFNPIAKSWVPAYGRMQLVPTSGGRDAYRFVYKQDKIVKGEYLFEPRNNIELGTAYLQVLKSTSFKNVENSECQLLCMVAAYNCGAGNVSRAMIGNTNLPKAIPHINSMNYNELFSHFSRRLPDETKNYIRKVTANIKKYSK